MPAAASTAPPASVPAPVPVPALVARASMSEYVANPGLDWEPHHDAAGNLVYKRRLGPTEASYYLASRGDGPQSGVNDMYLHIGFKAPPSKVTPARVLAIWTHMLKKHTLLSCKVEFSDLRDIKFVYEPLSSNDDAARRRAQELLDLRTNTESKGELLPLWSQTQAQPSPPRSEFLDSYLNGPRTLSDSKLSSLVISTPSPNFYNATRNSAAEAQNEADQDFDFYLLSGHFLGDGLALHHTANEFFRLLFNFKESNLEAEVDADVLRDSTNTSSTVDVAVSDKLSQIRLDDSRTVEKKLIPALESVVIVPEKWGRLQWAAADVIFQNQQRKLIGGHCFPRPAPTSSPKVRHTLVPTISYDSATTSRILKVCKSHSTTLSNAVFALCNVAWIRSSGIEANRNQSNIESSSLPINIYSAVNIRGILKDWQGELKEGEDKEWYALAIGYYNIILPSFIPRSTTLRQTFWYRALATRLQTGAVVKNPRMGPLTLLMARERENRSVGFELAAMQPKVAVGEEEKLKAQAEETKPLPSPQQQEKKVPSMALMGVSMLGNLDAVYAHSTFPTIKLHTLTTGSRQRNGSILLFAYTFSGKLYFSLGYDENGFKAGVIEAWWSELLRGVGEFLLEELLSNGSPSVDSATNQINFSLHSTTYDHSTMATTTPSPIPLKSLPSPPASAPPATPPPPAVLSLAPAPTTSPIHLASQSGDLATLHSLIDADPTLANAKDEQGITPLHWAAINNHLLAAKWLIEKGADVDARGGDLDATPLHWAARNGHFYIVHLLLLHSSDPTLLDSQSFNTLHLSVHSSSALLLAYLLFTLQPIAIDSSDLEGHTSLHWACYQGDSISVDLLLRSGASVLRSDAKGLTPLHWAAVKGNAACIKRLLEAGADVSARDGDGKTAKDMAKELKSLSAYVRGLRDAGFDEDGREITRPLGAKKTITAILLLPTITFGVVLQTIKILPWWSGLLLAAVEFYGMHHVISKVLLGVEARGDGDKLIKSPYFCSVIIGSLFWVGWVWVTRFVVATPGYAVSNLLFGILHLLCCYNLFRAITLDPGHVPKPSNEIELKETIEELVESGSFNGMNFCLSCLARRPLRSKHSSVTKRCTARFDHYCPWVWNDIGVNNHRQFLLFVSSLVFGVLYFNHLGFAYFSLSLPPIPTDEPSTCLFPAAVCASGSYDPVAVSVLVWATLQLSWTLILLGAQLWQIARQMTTLEVSNVSRYGFMGGQAGTPAVGQTGWNGAHAPGVAGGRADAAHVHGASCDHGPKPKVRSGSTNFLLKILGIDRFLPGGNHRGASTSSVLLKKASPALNPFDLGLLQNCFDFWSRGRELGVDYTRLYEVPEGGFGKMVRERKRREKENKAKAGASAGGGVLGGLVGRRMGSSKTTGYERVAMEERLEV